MNYRNVYSCSVILNYKFDFVLENWWNKKFYKKRKDIDLKVKEEEGKGDIIKSESYELKIKRNDLAEMQSYLVNWNENL